MTERLISIIKFAVAVLILPTVISVTITLFNNICAVAGIGGHVLSGIISYLILHLFIFEGSAFFEKGQAIVGVLFKFISPLANILSFALPIYAIIIFAAYSLISLFININSYIGIFIFLISFTAIFHIVNCAKSLSSKGDDFLRGNYFFALELIYILNIFIVAAILHCSIEKFLFIDFFNDFFKVTNYTYFLVVKQLFI